MPGGEELPIEQIRGAMTEADVALGLAFGAWVRGEFPQAKNIGEVVAALAQQNKGEADGAGSL